MLSRSVTLFWQRVNQFLRWTTLYMSNVWQGGFNHQFEIVGFTRPGIEPGSPRHETNALPLGYRSGKRLLCTLYNSEHCADDYFLNNQQWWQLPGTKVIILFNLSAYVEVLKFKLYKLLDCNENIDIKWITHNCTLWTLIRLRLICGWHAVTLLWYLKTERQSYNAKYDVCFIN